MKELPLSRRPERTAELAIVAACSRPLSAPARIDAIGAAAASPFDPVRLLATARRHRVEGFVAQGLAAAGLPVPADLTRRTAASRLQAMRNAGEEARIAGAMRAAGLDALFVKGTSLAILAHGSVVLKISWDIDLFVGPQQIAGACAVLETAGYRRTSFDGVRSERRIRRLLAGAKETVWFNADRGTHVELHAALIGTSGLGRGIGLASPRQALTVGPGATIPTLATGPLFAYLCIHGTTHAWARLKWLADVAALLAMSERSPASLRDEAIALGAGRCADVGILLCARLLGSDIPAPLVAAMEADPATRGLVTLAIDTIATPPSDDDRLAQGFRQIVAVQWSEFRFDRGLGYRVRTLRSVLGRPYHAAHLAVPRWALPAYMIAWLPWRAISRPFRTRQRGGGNTASTP